MKRINPAQATWMQPQFQDVKLCMRRRRRQSERVETAPLLSSSDKVIEISEAAAAVAAKTNDTSTKVCRQFAGGRRESGEEIESSGPGAIKSHSGSPAMTARGWVGQSWYVLNPQKYKLTRLIGFIS